MPQRPQDAPSRYVVGFDLGTTNSAVCYVDTEETPWQVRTFAVPQLVAAGSGRSPRNAAVVPLSAGGGRDGGRGVQRFGAQGTGARSPRTTSSASSPATTARCVPGRMINSAKSWLCHSGVDRTAPLLPWHGADDVERLSPVEVSARYLAHVRDAWDAPFPARAAGRAGFRAHAAGLVRRSRPRVDRQGGGRWPGCRAWC